MDDLDYDTLIENVLVFGTNHKKEAAREFFDAASDAEAIGDYDSARIYLQREPTNRHDPMAVKVIGSWDDGLGRKRKHIGYLPRQEAFRVATETEPSDKLRGRIVSLGKTDEHINIHIDVLVKPEF